MSNAAAGCASRDSNGGPSAPEDTTPALTGAGKRGFGQSSPVDAGHQPPVGTTTGTAGRAEWLTAPVPPPIWWLRGSWRAWLPRFLVLVERLPHLNLVHPADRAIGFAIVELEDGELWVSADVEGC